MRPWWAVAILAAGCGPVVPASDRVPTSAGMSTSGGDPDTRPASEAPHGDGSDDELGDENVKLDFNGSAESGDRCPRTAEVEPLPTAIELLVDVSQTMATRFVDHDGDGGTPAITRWNMLASALAEHLPVLADEEDVGLQIFPAVDAAAPPAVAACDATVGPAVGASVDELLAELPPPDATFMLGATPTASAFSSASARLQQIEPGGRGFIVLLTDGAPNCDPADSPPALFDEVHDEARGWAEYAFGMGITTYVVAMAVPAGQLGGGPEGDPFADHGVVLQSIANAGGTNLMIAGDAVDLDGALTFIELTTSSCRARVPDDLLGAWFNVEVDGLQYYEISFDQCTFADGFALVGGGKLDTIELCGNACAAFRAVGTATLTESCAIPE